MNHVRVQLGAFSLILGVSVGLAQEPEPAILTVNYDIRDLTHGTRTLQGLSLSRDANTPEEKLTSLLRSIAEITKKPSIRIIDQSHLLVRTHQTGHDEIASFLAAIRRIHNVSLKVRGSLYEVDDVFYTRVKHRVDLPLDELEKLFIEGKKLPGEKLLKDLLNEKMILRGEWISIDDRRERLFLGQRDLLVFRSNREDFYQRLEKQILMAGTTLHGVFEVSADRRFVRAHITEKLRELQKVERSKQPVVRPIIPDGIDVTKNLIEQEKIASRIDEEVFPVDQTVTTLQHLPDNGTGFIALKTRPKSLEERNRWYVLTISATIHIEEEEREYRRQALKEMLPNLVKQVLTLPRLQSARLLFEDPKVSGFALIKSDVWDWPDSFEIPDRKVVMAPKEEGRLLGIRIDSIETGDIGTQVTVSLVNAGGRRNDAGVGVYTLRYRTRGKDLKEVELVD